MEESYLRPTESYIQRKIRTTKDEGTYGPLDSDYDVSNLHVHEMERKVVNGRHLPAIYEFDDKIPTPANSSPSPILYRQKEALFDDETGVNNVHYRKMGKKTVRTVEFTREMHRMVISKLLDPTGKKKTGTVIYRNNFGNVPKKSKSKNVQIQKKDEFDEMHEMMSHVDSKLLHIETDLAYVLGNPEMRKKIPQSENLLKQIQAEYERIEKEYITDAQELLNDGYYQNQDESESNSYFGEGEPYL
jgi:hypothetical protein